jgi:hypothetical protein
LKSLRKKYFSSILSEISTEGWIVILIIAIAIVFIFLNGTGVYDSSAGKPDIFKESNPKRIKPNL